MAFVLQDVIKELEESRSVDPIKKLKKTNLAKVAAHFRITPPAGATKSHIFILIEEHCVKHDIISEVEERPTVETAEVLKLQLEFERVLQCMRNLVKKLKELAKQRKLKLKKLES